MREIYRKRGKGITRERGRKRERDRGDHVNGLRFCLQRKRVRKNE